MNNKDDNKSTKQHLPYRFSIMMYSIFVSMIIFGNIFLTHNINKILIDIVGVLAIIAISLTLLAVREMIKEDTING